MMNLLEQQNNFQKEAKGVLERLQLMEFLSKYGQPNIVGSLKLGTMTWRDIDIEVVCDEVSLRNVAELAGDLIEKIHKRIDFGIIDNRDISPENPRKTPRGIYLGIKYYKDEIEDIYVEEKVKGEIWKIDIQFVLKKDEQGRVYTDQLKDKITDENRKIILEIKSELTKSPKHRKEIFSIDVYRAVLDEGVKDLEGFKKNLRRTGREF